MKKILLLVLFFLMVFLVFFIACEKKDVFNNLKKSDEINLTAVSIPCGSISFYDLISEFNSPIGTLSIYNDNQNVSIKINILPGEQLLNSQLFVGKCKDVPSGLNDELDFSSFPYSQSHPLGTSSYVYTIPIDSGMNCYCVALHLTLSGMNKTEVWAYSDEPGSNDDRLIYYCLNECRYCTISLGDFRTQTQGAWGATPKGNNPGFYLHSNFTSAFPNGLKVGCSGGYTLLFTSAQAITNFLPQGGTPVQLSQNYTDPSSQLSVLAGQTVALALSLGFDSYDPNFSTSSNSLGNLVMASGIFQGWTVSQIFAEANKILGACASPYSPSQITSALDAINTNFDGGTANGNNLYCSH